MEKALIVTRHPALVQVLREDFGIDGELLSHATEEDVRGKHVYGVLPMRLAALTSVFTEVSLVVPPDLRGQELTAEQVRSLHPQLVSYTVRVTE